VADLIGHADIVRELHALAASENPPHALLFAGTEGSGRMSLAIHYAMLLNCDRAAPPPAGASLFGDDLPPAARGAIPCGECRPCRLIAEGVHPDVIVLAPGDTLCKPRDGESHPKHPESRDIRICQIRGVIELAARYPFEARYRAIIINPAERFGNDAGHALLKTLEEPPGHTVFCLLSAAPEAIIETIISRCRRIDVRLVAKAEIEAGLVARGIEPEVAARAAEASGGRPGRAIVLAGQPDLMGDRARLLARCARIASEGWVERFSYANDLTERYRRDRGSVTPELDAWEAFWEEHLRTGESQGDSKQQLAGALEALRAIAQLRTDLLANVNTRAAFELMLLSFPRVTLAVTPEEEPVAYA
jgi:DNA polymerase III subunit delta'